MKKELSAQEREQEKKSNLHVLSGMRYILITMAVVWVLAMANIFLIDKMLTSVAFLSMGLMLIIPITTSQRMELTNPKVKYIFLLIVCVATSTVAGILSYHAVLIYIVPLLFAAQYRDRKALWITYGINTVTLMISMWLGLYYGICDLNLVFEGTHTREWIINAVNNGETLKLNENVDMIVLVFGVFPRSIILFVICLMLQYVVMRSSEDAVQIAELTWHKDIDSTTRLFNKNKYEEMVASYYPSIKRIGVIFWDINNLKITNDKYGHDKGDEVIKALTEQLYGLGTDRCRSYRVGGDEFVVIIDNPTAGETVETILKVRRALEENRIKGEIEVSSAVGWAEGAGEDVTKVATKADANMYADKQRYKGENKR